VAEHRPHDGDENGSAIVDLGAYEYMAEYMPGADAIFSGDFESGSLEENFEAFMDAIKRNRPSAAKGTYIRSVTVSSTMGPCVSIDPTGYR